MAKLLPPSPSGIAIAAQALREGALVAFPTETVYGLGADALNPQAVAKIFEVKGRPSNNPLIVHVAEATAVLELTQPNARQRGLLDTLQQFWPGPLSLVLPAKSSVPRLVTAGQDSVAVRVPSHEVGLALLRASGLPLAAPSANPSNYLSPTSAQQVLEQLGTKIDFVLDGGACTIGLESTVLSLLEERPRLLRPGAITLQQLESVLGPVLVAGGQQGPLLSPGMLALHYAPRSKLLLRPQVVEVPAFSYSLIRFSELQADALSASAVHTSILSHDGNLLEVAAGLFGALYEHDQLGVAHIICDTCAEKGIGLAIMDRLRRAAATCA